MWHSAEPSGHGYGDPVQNTPVGPLPLSSAPAPVPGFALPQEPNLSLRTAESPPGALQLGRSGDSDRHHGGERPGWRRTCAGNTSSETPMLAPGDRTGRADLPLQELNDTELSSACTDRVP